MFDATDYYMTKGISSKFRLFSIVISLLSLGTLLYDFFISNEFNIEAIFLLGISVILVLNVLRLLSKSRGSKRWISFLTNACITIITCFNFFILALTLFGYGFSGAHIHSIWFMATFLNILLFSTSVFEMTRKREQ